MQHQPNKTGVLLARMVGMCVRGKNKAKQNKTWRSEKTGRVSQRHCRERQCARGDHRPEPLDWLAPQGAGPTPESNGEQSQRSPRTWRQTRRDSHASFLLPPACSETPVTVLKGTSSTAGKSVNVTSDE